VRTMPPKKKDVATPANTGRRSARQAGRPPSAEAKSLSDIKKNKKRGRDEQDADPEPAQKSPKSTVKASPKAAPKPSPKVAAKSTPKAAPKASPKVAAKASQKPSPKEAPKASPKVVAKASPKVVAKASPKPSSKAAPKASPKPSPKVVAKASPKAAPKASPKVVAKASPKAAPKASPKPSPKVVAKAPPKPSPKAAPKASPKVVAKKPTPAKKGNKALAAAKAAADFGKHGDDEILLPVSDPEDDSEEEEDDEEEEVQEEVQEEEVVPKGTPMQIDAKSTEKMKKQIKALKTGGDEEGQDRGVIYLGHIPYGFFEDQMKGFFGQFGDVTRLRLSRSKKTGRSKGYAFIEFEDAGVAEVVAQTMDKYLLFDRILSCRVVPHDELHPKTFDGANKKFRVMPNKKIARERHNAPKTQWAQKRTEKKLLGKEAKKRQKLKDLGIDYEFPGYAAHKKDAPQKKRFKSE